MKEDLFKFNLHPNNIYEKARRQRMDFVCVGVSGLDLSNGTTKDNEIGTANLCDDTLKSEILISYIF